MSKWDDEFAAHPVWASVDQIQALLDQCPATDDADRQDHLNRIRRLVVELDARREVDPTLVSTSVLNSIHSDLAPLNNHLSAYINQPELWTSYLAPAATTYAEPVLPLLMQLPLPPRSPATRAAARAATAYRDAADELVEALRDKVKTVIAAVEDDRLANAEATEKALANIAALTTSVSQTESRITDQLARLDTALTAYQSAFETKQGERADRFGQDLEAMRDKVQAVGEELHQSARQRAETEQAASAGRLAELHDLHEQAKAVVEATGRRAVTTEFGEYARKERQSAFWWSIAAVVFALFGFGLIGSQVLTLGNEDLSWQLVAYKITASLALVLVAGYAGKQSAGHRDQERQAKRRQLEINALEPFLSRLPEEQQQELRARMADRILIQPQADRAETPQAAAPATGDIGALLASVLREYNNKTTP